MSLSNSISVVRDALKILDSYIRKHQLVDDGDELDDFAKECSYTGDMCRVKADEVHKELLDLLEHIKLVEYVVTREHSLAVGG